MHGRPIIVVHSQSSITLVAINRNFSNYPGNQQIFSYKNSSSNKIFGK